MMNGTIGRFNGGYREPHSGRLPIQLYSGFRAPTEQWIEEYNQRRPHEALQNRTLSEWKQQNQP